MPDMMTPFKMRIAPLVGLCVAAIGIASNLLNLADNTGTPLGPRYSLAATALLLCIIFAVISTSKCSRSTPFTSQITAGFWPIRLLGLQAIALARTALTDDLLTQIVH
jgi:hypothetical protein